MTRPDRSLPDDRSAPDAAERERLERIIALVQRLQGVVDPKGSVHKDLLAWEQAARRQLLGFDEET